jgi:hypothetical protein
MVCTHVEEAICIVPLGCRWKAGPLLRESLVFLFRISALHLEEERGTSLDALEYLRRDR